MPSKAGERCCEWNGHRSESRCFITYRRGLKQVSARSSCGFAIRRRGMEGKAPWWVSSTAPRPAATPCAQRPIGRRRARGGWTCPDCVPHSTSLVSLAAVPEPFLTCRRVPSQAPTVAFSPQRCSTRINPLHGPVAEGSAVPLLRRLSLGRGESLHPQMPKKLSPPPPRRDPQPTMDRFKKLTKAQPLLQGGTRRQGHTHARAPVQNSLDRKSKDELHFLPRHATSCVPGQQVRAAEEAGAGD